MKINDAYLAPVVHPFTFERRPGKWKFILTSPLQITFPKDYWGKHEFADEKNCVWAKAEARDWTISKGYAWDGASCAPDFPETIAASCWHDAAGQFRHLPCIQTALSGGVWNHRFAEIIESQGAPKIATLYYIGLTLGNPVYSLLGKLFGKKPSGRCKLQ